MFRTALVSFAEDALLNFFEPDSKGEERGVDVALV
jgi:hypothetical protein